MLRGGASLARGRTHPRSHFVQFGKGSRRPAEPPLASTGAHYNGAASDLRHSVLVSRVTASATQILPGSSFRAHARAFSSSGSGSASGPNSGSGAGGSTSAQASQSDFDQVPPELAAALADPELSGKISFAKEGDVIEGMPPDSARRIATNIPVDDEHLEKVRQALASDSKREARKDNPEGQAAPTSNEKLRGRAEKQEFQAETRKLLDIVAHSLYTDKEVFVRELISNSSDALEKLRYARALNGEIDSGNSLEINVYADKKNNTLTIQDTGIGMSKEEMILNLGSIGRSGSLAFLQELQQGVAQSEANHSAKPLTDVIGKFGVGFYSVFMVSRDVKVFSRASSADDDAPGWCWSSDGSGSYTMQEADDVERGTKIVIKLDGHQNQEYASRDSLERIIKKYSNFVGFTINVNGEQVNTVRPLWTLPKSEISDDEHKEFYQFISHAYDSPRFNLHYSTDAPLNIRSLMYVGHSHSEKFGMGRMETGISLFSRKVLIQHKADALLPDWLRFIKGVVDSEDVPLNLSREHLQDSALIRKMNGVLTRRVLRWLSDEAKRDPQGYNLFFRDFGFFLKEGACADAGYREDLAKLMRYESSATKAGETTSFEDYLSRAGEQQQSIYYIISPSRDLAERSPYFEAFKSSGTEVLFLYTPLDDFVMTNIAKFKGKKVLSIEAADAVPPSAEETGKDGEEAKESKKEVEPWVPEFTTWLQDALAMKVSSVRSTERLRDSPAIVVDHESGAFRRMMRHVDPERAAAQKLPKQQLEINVRHPIITRLNTIRTTNSALAQLVAEQVFDNALVQAGLLDDARTMVPRMNQLLESALAGGQEDSSSANTISSNDTADMR